MIPTATLYLTARKAWRKWLEGHFSTVKEIWLVFPNKVSGKPRIPYSDAVEEALCFGWIDSTVKKFDKDSVIQRFSPRSLKSSYSQANKERLKWLIKHKRVHPDIEKIIRPIIEEEFIFPEDIVKVIKKDPDAWRNYLHFSDSYKRIRVAYIDGARERPEEFKKRLEIFIKKTKANELVKGFGGIEKYY